MSYIQKLELEGILSENDINTLKAKGIEIIPLEKRYNQKFEGIGIKLNNHHIAYEKKE